MKSRTSLILAVLCALGGRFARADEYHYRNILIGEAAAALGGAFSAIANDPSGAYYNPAGLVDTKDGFFSAQANAITSNSQVYKNIKEGQDYTSKAGGLVAAYFGATQKLWGYRVAFNLVVPDSDLVDQNDEITGISATAGATNRFLRKLSRQNTLFLTGPAIASALNENLSWGLSLFAFMRVDRVVDTQFVTYNPEPTGKYLFQDTYLARNAYGLMPKLGLRYKWNATWTSALTLGYTLNLFGNGLLRRVQNKVDPATGLPVTPNGELEHDTTTTNRDDLSYKEPAIIRVTLGNAYRVSPSLLLTADLDFYSSDPNFEGFSLEPTYNWSLGAEILLSDTLPLRLGIFSNNANTPALDPARKNQVPHVNLLGGAIGISLLSDKTSVTAGFSYAFGSGQGQILTDSATIQEVQQTSYGLYLSGSYQL